MTRIQTTAKILFYQVDRCGYYPYRTAGGSFCNLLETLNLAFDWTNRPAVTISETATFEPAQDSDDLPVYCYAMAKDDASNDFLLTTWNATPNREGQTTAVNGQSHVGQADVKSSNFPDGYIPGFETYFWFIPKDNIFATVRFDRTNNGQTGMCQFLWGYLANYSPYIFEYENDGETESWYGQTKEEAQRLRPLFLTNRYKLRGRLTKIHAQRDQIVKTIQKTNLSPGIQAIDQNYLQVVLEKLGMECPRYREIDIPIRNELSFTPTIEELEQIIQTWERTGAHGGTNDVGFRLKGNTQEILWLSSSLAKNDWPVTVDTDTEGIIEASSLLDALEKAKEDILRHTFRNGL